MRSKAFSIIIWWLATATAMGQYSISGKVTHADTDAQLEMVQVYNKTTNTLVYTDERGGYKLEGLKAGVYELIVFSYEYQVIEKAVKLAEDTALNFTLKPLGQELTAVVVSQKREQIFSITRLRPVEGTSIFAGKKNEVVLVDQTVGNLAANNARQVYAQVVGLNIYDNVDAGLQLNVGGRGLDPNRTANFNTRQNGYDISADVLGYPESYYTPPAEALEQIQVIRGAASLQYGTQFGGLINFKLKKPVTTKKIEVVSRQSTGSFGLFTSFNSLSGTAGKFSYYTYFNYKQGNGSRANAEFSSKNWFGNFNYELSDRTKLSLDLTYLHYLAQQAGGLTDTEFRQNPRQSTRTRNWFEVNWKLAALKLEHKFSASTDFSLSLFGLDAERNAVGFRGNPVNLNDNPVNALDEQETDGSFVNPRDLIKGQFRNWGAEARLLSRYQVQSRDAVFLVGAKYYHANNTSLQGPGSRGVDADFGLATDRFPDYANQADFSFPNRNFALFGENIFFISNKLSITPGFRFEYIKTESEGVYQQVNFDNAGNPIFNQQLTDNRSLERSFVLLGVGASYDHSDELEVYANISQNYRSVTFSDIRVVSPTFIIDPDISDEEGFTADLGIRGKWGNQLSYDLGGFGLLYNDRLGTILDDRANRVRTNIGKAFIYGLEAFVDWNIMAALKTDNSQYKLNWFVNGALTDSEYLASDQNNVEGRKVEFIPAVNLKTGLNAGYRNLLASVQFTYLSEQFTDAENSEIPATNDAREGTIGQIPAYSILDISLAYAYRNWRIETGVNNVLDNNYFTRRATGYPGPGIIPSDPRTFYVTVGVRF